MCMRVYVDILWIKETGLLYPKDENSPDVMAWQAG